METQIGKFNGKFDRKGDIFLKGKEKCDMCGENKAVVLGMNNARGEYCSAYICMDCLQNIVDNNNLEV